MTNTRTKQKERTLYIILAAALAARLLLALVTEGYTYDMSCFVAWGDKLASEGPAAFYSADYFADYPPGYILVLGLVSLVRKALQLSYESRWTYFLLALIPAICDCAAVVLLDHISRRYMGQGRAQRCLVLFAAFCPLTLFDTGIWKQIDGAFALPLLLCFWLLEERRDLLAAVLYGVALAIKPQALLAGPVLAVCFLVAIADAVRDGKSPLKSVGQIFGGAALALLPPLLAGLPFYGAKNLVPSLIDKYITTASGYQYATINAFNWFAALGGNWQALDACPVFDLSWKVLGIFNIAVITVLLVVLAVISWRAGRFSPLLLAAFYTVGIFTFAHCMHERYLVLGMLLVLLAAARWNDIRLYGAGFGLSITGFLNLETVYTLVGSDDEWLSSDTSREFAMAVGFAETAAFVLLAFTAWAICRHGAISPLAKVETIEKDKTKTVQKKLELCTLRIDPQPAWTAKEKKALATLTLIVAVVSFAYLGSMKAPQNPVDATDSTATIDFTPQQDAVEIWVYPGISTGGSLRITDAAGNELYRKEMLHRMTAYETTHPPLGKDFIMLGIAIFGMTAFGWRCAGTLFGVMLVPLMWCFARRLTHKRWAGAMAGALIAAGFMRFSQSRIATIDIYGTFFILLGAYFMVWYCQSVLQNGVNGSLLPMALGGVAFGLGCASKWTGIYAGAGLAVLYLGVLYARWKQKQPGFWKEFRMAAVGGVAFYIVVPFLIYLASYLPYWWKDPTFGLRDWWDCQTYMYWYHSTLKATHPFESRWYTWLLDLRPVWYYKNSYLEAGLQGSIAGFYNPVICWAGLFCILLLLWRQVSARGTAKGAGVLILYASQLLSWMLVSRCTFMYHYFPSSVFALTAIVLVLTQMKRQDRAKKIGAGLCIAALVCFAWFSPVLSGLPVPTLWAQSTKILPSYGLY